MSLFLLILKFNSALSVPSVASTLTLSVSPFARSFISTIETDTKLEYGNELNATPLTLKLFHFFVLEATRIVASGPESSSSIFAEFII